MYKARLDLFKKLKSLLYYPAEGMAMIYLFMFSIQRCFNVINEVAVNPELIMGTNRCSLGVSIILTRTVYSQEANIALLLKKYIYVRVNIFSLWET